MERLLFLENFITATAVSYSSIVVRVPAMVNQEGQSTLGDSSA